MDDEARALRRLRPVRHVVDNKVRLQLRRQRRGQLIGPTAAAVEDADFRGAQIVERHRAGPRRAAGAQQHGDLAAHEIRAEAFAQRFRQSRRIGVAAFDFSVVVEDQ